MKLHVVLVQQTTDTDSMVTKRGLEKIKVKNELSSSFVPVILFTSMNDRRSKSGPIHSPTLLSTYVHSLNAANY